MTTPQQQMPSAAELLMGGGVTSVKFPTIGTTVIGRITQPASVEQQRDFTTGDLKFYDDGKPQYQVVVTLSTSERDPANPDDDGTRRLYIKGQMAKAVSQAVRAAGAPELQVGGTLTVTYSHDGEKKNPRFNAPKNFTAQYVSAAATELHAPEPVPNGLTPQQAVAAQQNPATQALLAQQQAVAANAATPPPF
ncbi:hypothetical protein [Streptomyces gardneri]|uniref:hypothetical protein n=1 Tax=Streptomyces gardneri TaxID=66892 RepID=UPI0033EF1CDC